MMNELKDQSVLTDDDKVLVVCKRHLTSIKSQRSEKDWEDFRNDAYYRGKHFTVFNTSTKTLEEPPAQQGQIRLPIHLARDFVDRVKRDVTGKRPTWDTAPANTSEEAVKEARWQNMFLDALYEKQKVGRKIKSIVADGLKFFRGVAEVYWDSEQDDGQGEIDFRVVSPSDFYMPTQFSDPADSPCVIKIIRKDIGYLLNSDLYSKYRPKWVNKLKPDNKYTDSEWKEMTMARAFGTSMGDDDIPSPQGTVLLAECYLKYYKKGETTPSWRLVTFSAKQDIILRNEETDLDRPPFFVYYPEPEENEHLGESLLGRLVPSNKALDLLENKILAHNNAFIGGKYIADLGADPSLVTSEPAQIIEVNPGRRFEALNVPQLPPSSRDTVESWHRYGQDSAGVHEATMGRVPQGVESGRGLEALRQGDFEAKSDYVDNLEEFMSDLGKYAIKLGSENYTSSRQVTLYNEMGGYEQFKVIGQSSPNEGRDQVADVVLKPTVSVRVVMGSGLGNTPEARQDKAMELYHMNLIPREEVLKEFGYGSIADLADRAYKQGMEVMQAKKENPPPPPTQIKDILQFNADTFFTPEEKMQLKQRLFEIKPSPIEEQDTQALQTANQMHLATHQSDLKMQQDAQKAQLDASHAELQNTHTQEQGLMNSLLSQSQGDQNA